MDGITQTLNQDELLTKIAEFLLTYGVPLITALLVLFLGWWLVGRVVGLLDKGLAKAGYGGSRVSSGI